MAIYPLDIAAAETTLSILSMHVGYQLVIKRLPCFIAIYAWRLPGYLHGYQHNYSEERNLYISQNLRNQTFIIHS